MRGMVCHAGSHTAGLIDFGMVLCCCMTLVLTATEGTQSGLEAVWCWPNGLWSQWHGAMFLCANVGLAHLTRWLSGQMRSVLAETASTRETRYSCIVSISS